MSMRSRLNSYWVAVLAAVLLLVSSASSQALLVWLNGDRLTVVARQDPLRHVLKRLAHAGVVVKIDPAITARVTGEIAGEDIETALQTLLEDFGYVLIWDVVEGPLGSIPRIAEVHIFRPGNPGAIEPLPGIPSNLTVSSGPGGNGASFVADEILMGFKPGTDVAEFRRLLEQIGASVIDSIPELGIYRVRLVPGANVIATVAQLGQDPIVAAVEPNYVYEVPTPGKVSPVASDGSSSPQPLLEGGPPVAVLDSGLQSVDVLGDHVVGKYDAMQPDREITDPVGHGTQMALIAAGVIQPGGALPESANESVPVIAIRSFDDNGVTSSFGIMRSLDYAYESGARVANMSWGSHVESSFLASAIGAAQSKGLILVAAAGNEPSGKPLYPAAYKGVISVSALSPSGSIWDKSNFGDSIFLAAPGQADMPIGYRGDPGAYAGTSIASAYVSRALTRYFSQHPKATSKDAINALVKALTDKGAKGKDPYFGYGALDAEAWDRFLKQAR